MLIEDIADAMKCTKKKLKGFALTVGAALAIIGCVLALRGKAGPSRVFLGIAVSLVTAGFAAPALLTPIYKAWMAFGSVLGWVMTRVILIALFYLVVTPIGLLMRAFGKGALKVKPDPSRATYWKERPAPERGRHGYENQY